MKLAGYCTLPASTSSSAAAAAGTAVPMMAAHQPLGSSQHNNKPQTGTFTARGLQDGVSTIDGSSSAGAASASNSGAAAILDAGANGSCSNHSSSSGSSQPPPLQQQQQQQCLSSPRDVNYFRQQFKPLMQMTPGVDLPELYIGTQVMSACGRSHHAYL
jgi:hypothetical protein